MINSESGGISHSSSKDTESRSVSLVDGSILINENHMGSNGAINSSFKD
jgi:hypothetical protein